ncbi:hypothetical protein CEXT_273951 [Caerostris extrusa]|uniref:Uncharacterized protein n=1 Tax=Caerostris extrusa TaxID=172846 RepID=A0AAV4NS46_CAEEX|nr:hypothetical protein CEXT_273951 [Caerostris extrusa]
MGEAEKNLLGIKRGKKVMLKASEHGKTAGTSSGAPAESRKRAFVMCNNYISLERLQLPDFPGLGRHKLVIWRFMRCRKLSECNDSGKSASRFILW